MLDSNVYALTARGQNELRGSATTLTAAEIELLVRIDGVLSVAQLKAGLSTEAAAAFDVALRRLVDRALLSLAEADPFTEKFKAQLSRLAMSEAESEADAGTASLTKAGYYVSIARKRAVQRPSKPGSALSAIVVDDDPLLAKVIQTYLSFEGFQVRLAGNRSEIVAEFRSPPIPDLILLDVMLPDADGFDILLRLRQHPALRHVPVIMLTGVATREAVLKGLASGADGYVTKPFDAEALMQAVRTVVGLADDPTTPTDLWSDKPGRS